MANRTRPQSAPATHPMSADRLDDTSPTRRPSAGSAPPPALPKPTGRAVRRSPPARWRPRDVDLVAEAVRERRAVRSPSTRARSNRRSTASLDPAAESLEQREHDERRRDDHDRLTPRQRGRAAWWMIVATMPAQDAGHDRVRDRPADDPVDLVQPVAQDRDADGDRQERRRQDPGGPSTSPIPSAMRLPTPSSARTDDRHDAGRGGPAGLRPDGRARAPVATDEDGGRGDDADGVDGERDVSGRRR